MDKNKYNQKVNKKVILCWSTIAFVLVIAYIIEVFKGIRSPFYVLLFSIFTITPLIITLIFNKKWNGTNLNIKYFATIGYIIFYTFSLLTTNSRVSFVYIIPMISILIVYCDSKITSILYIYSILLNFFVIGKNFINGANTKQDITFYEIQIACLCLSYFFLKTSLTLIKENEDKMFELSDSLIIDELTMAYNRKFISHKIIPKFQEHHKNGISIAFLDIDHFGDFNNNYGHDFGDEVLKHMSSLVLNSIKDTKDTYFIRNGGDEFILISFHLKYSNFVEICEKIRKNIEEKNIEYKEKNIKTSITISIGCANSFIEKQDDFFDLRDKADTRLYIAKSNGRNMVCSK